MFLDNVKSVVDSLQTQQIISKMNIRKERGELTTRAEYQEQMAESMFSLHQAGGKATYSPTVMPLGRAYSELINKNFEDMAYDLTVIFAEMSNLYEVINNHRDYYRKNSRESIRMVNQLESNLEKAKIEAGSDNVFNQVRVNNFSDRSTAIAGDHPEISQMYYDTRSDKVRFRTEDLLIDNTNRRLVLQSTASQPVPISVISIIETETSSSLYDLRIRDVNLKDILREEATTWFFSVNSEDSLDSVSLALNIDLGDKKEVNTFRLEVNNKNPVELTELSYLDELGMRQQMVFEGEIIKDSYILSFPTVIARDFKLVLRQYSSVLMSYDANSNSYGIEDLQRIENIPHQGSLVEDIVREELTNPTVKKIIVPESLKIENKRTLYNFTIGIKEIECTKDDLSDYGIFVGKELAFFNSNMIALDTSEEVPNQTHKMTKEIMPVAAIEHSLMIKEYDGSENLVRTRELDILPLSKDKVEVEALLFNTHKRTLALRFLGHLTSGDGSNIQIYRDGELLVRGSDWRFSDRIDTGDDGDSNILPNQEQTLVQILDSDEVIGYSYYYASYTPRFLAEPNRITYDKSFKYNGQKAVELDSTIYGTFIQNIKVYPKVIVRPLAKEIPVTPIVYNLQILAREVLNV